MTLIDQMKKEIAELKGSIQRDKLQAINDKIAKYEAKEKGDDLAKREREKRPRLKQWLAHLTAV